MAFELLLEVRLNRTRPLREVTVCSVGEVDMTGWLDRRVGLGECFLLPDWIPFRWCFSLSSEGRRGFESKIVEGEELSPSEPDMGA